MKVSGFTFVRNAIKYDYPVVEAITSILPLCDEFVVCLGNSDDGTEELIKSLKDSVNNCENYGGGLNSVDKIKIIHSVWDDTLRTGGKVLAVETNKAFDAIAADSDWAFYIQADEVVHEKYLPVIKQAMEQCLDNHAVECLVLKYLHFYGNYKYVGDSRNWYRREIRIVRNNKSIRSYKDAQGFRHIANVSKHSNESSQIVDNHRFRKLNGRLIDAYVYHYGWVRNPRLQTAKQVGFEKLYNANDEKLTIKQDELVDYNKVTSLALFDGEHPKVMQPRINAMDWDFEFDTSNKNLSFKYKVLQWIEKVTGRRLFEFKNYKLV
ncbi:hypothetical protein FACS189452_09160 [Bacteroidia bacterium]|nr:hypothetical protein FACS189452_09160 [Bacteroidia bacterium]